MCSFLGEVPIRKGMQEEMYQESVLFMEEKILQVLPVCTVQFRCMKFQKSLLMLYGTFYFGNFTYALAGYAIANHGEARQKCLNSLR